MEKIEITEYDLLQEARKKTVNSEFDYAIETLFNLSKEDEKCLLRIIRQRYLEKGEARLFVRELLVFATILSERMKHKNDPQ